MLKNRPTKQVFFHFALSLLFLSCVNEGRQAASIHFNHHCGSCHLTPKSRNIPKDIWKNSVLPEMAARMGYRYNDYDPYAYHPLEEKAYIDVSKKYPKEPIIDSATWWSIYDYIISQAPDTIPIDVTRKRRNDNLDQFSTKKIEIPELTSSIITAIQFDTVSKLFAVADANGRLQQWPKQNLDAQRRFNSAVTSYFKKPNGVFVTEVGVLNPSEVPAGVLSKITSSVSDTIAKKLHRPVFVETVDLNSDGKEEFLICEFGNLTGQLSLLEATEFGYDKKTLYPLPGAVKLEIADMNNDGKKDIVALFSQGNEGIFIFYQESELRFSSEQVIGFPPEYGSSWFELLDYDADGDLDIVLTNGDNADYSIFLKPYHGIRLFLNDGANSFEQNWFYPVYGATRVLADDYDLDGDIDFAVSAFFNDLKNAPREGFIYLENKSSAEFEFQPYTFKENYGSGWLTMAKGDYDLDGDIDILVGSFNAKGLRKANTVFESKKEDVTKLILLENKEKSNHGF